MRAAFIIIAVAAYTLFAHEARADEVWQCTDSKGHSYQVSQKVPSDSCRKLKSKKEPADAAATKTPPATRPRWGAEAFCASQKTATCQVLDATEENGILNGVAFRLRRNGASVVGNKDGSSGAWEIDSNWRINCVRDKMISLKSCLLRFSDLRVFISSGGGALVAVGTDHYPGTTTSIKIGSSRFDTPASNGAFADGEKMIALMRNGTPVITRYTKWPNRYWIDSEFDVFGLDTAIRVARWVIANGDL